MEHAPTLRQGGYMIDFWGAGFDVAERMGLIPELRRRGYGSNNFDWWTQMAPGSQRWTLPRFAQPLVTG